MICFLVIHVLLHLIIKYIFFDFAIMLLLISAVPTPPHDLRVTPVSETELHVAWQPPRTPNGNITHYYVLWRPLERAQDYFDQHDYCVDGTMPVSGLFT